MGVAMEFRLKGNATSHQVDIRSLPSGLEVTIDGQEYTVDLVKLNKQTLSLILDGTSHDIYFTEHQGLITVTVDSSQFQIEKDVRKSGKKEHRKTNANVGSEPIEIFAPMPGKIIKLLCSQDCEVSEGEGLLIIEAMKMENELTSPASGKIQKIHVTEGATVEADETLISIGK